MQLAESKRREPRTEQEEQGRGGDKGTGRMGETENRGAGGGEAEMSISQLVEGSIGGCEPSGGGAGTSVPTQRPGN